MLATTGLSLVGSFAAPLVGRLVDRRSIRTLMMFGAACLATGFAAVSQITALWQFWLCFALILPVANLLLGQLTSAALVTRWFEAQRGRAMGLSSLGTSIGGFSLPLLLATATQFWGWRTATLVIGVAVAAAVALVTLAWVHDGPPQGREGSSTTHDDIPLSTTQILSAPAFWIVTLVVGVKLATYLGLVSNLVPYAGALGVSRIGAATLLSLLSITSMVGKIGFGALADRIALPAMLIAALTLTIAGFAALLVAKGYPSLVVGCLMLGLATGGMLPLWGLLVGRYFGPASFGRVLGMTNFVMVPLTATSAPLAGWVFDRTGNYDAIFILYIAALGFAIAIVVPLFALRHYAADAS